MDTATFLLERETLQARMESRRQETAAAIAERQKGFVPRLLRTGSDVIFGFGSQGESAGWLASLLWVVLAPVVVEATQRGGDALVKTLLRTIFPRPSSKPSETSTTPV